jgi:diguanylate cyclase (GGDEF)-like protein
MLNKIFKLIKELHNIDDEEFERVYMQENYKRLLPALIILYMLEWVLYLIEHKIFNVGAIILTYQIINTVVIIILIYMSRRFEKLTTKALKAPLYFWSVATLFFGIALVFFIQSEADLIHMYMMMILGVNTFVCLNPKERLFIITIPSLVFFFGLPFFQGNAGIVNVGRINTLAFTFFTLFLTYNHYLLKYREFLSKKELSAKNILLEKLSKKDLMTDLYNHKTILEILRKSMEEAKRYGKILSIMLIDIDNFKKINDKFGHVMGDKAIIMLADTLREHSRATDDIGRYGGEEFLVVMANTSLEGAKNYYDRIQTSLRRQLLASDFLFTISAGTAEYKMQDITNFLVDADKNLYKAKTIGKDCCV